MLNKKEKKEALKVIKETRKTFKEISKTLEEVLIGIDSKLENLLSKVSKDKIEDDLELKIAINYIMKKSAIEFGECLTRE